ncbi:uncharacterized protein LOC141614858 [Silene latifolia]|uniref:uncharacterized protein LOC141614858 n=1 Tax=Silene latifolia TaxID=37657 RepID=UPI003D76D45D
MNSSAGCLKSDDSAGMNMMMNSKIDNPIYPEASGSGSDSDSAKQEDDTQVEFRDPRLGHIHFLKDCLLNPLLAVPPEYRPDYIEDPDNPVVGFRLNNTSRLVIPVTALDRARETIQKHQNTPFQPLTYGDFGFGGYGSSTGMAPAPPSSLSEADLFRQIIQDREEAAKKLDDRLRDEPEQVRKGDLRLAQEAIKFYNTQHGTSYEVVATLGSYHHLHFGHWLHCNFKARDTKCRSSQPKLFFSELFCPGAEMISAKVCTMLDGPGQRPHTVRGCKFCGDQLLHPVNGFECGK